MPPPRWDAIGLRPNTDRGLHVVRFPLRKDHHHGRTSCARTCGRSPSYQNWHWHSAPAHIPDCQLPKLGEGSQLCEGDQETAHRIRRCRHLPHVSTAGRKHPDAAAGDMREQTQPQTTSCADGTSAWGWSGSSGAHRVACRRPPAERMDSVPRMGPTGNEELVMGPQVSDPTGPHAHRAT